MLAVFLLFSCQQRDGWPGLSHDPHLRLPAPASYGGPVTDIAEWAESRFGFYVDRHWQGDKWVLERGPIRLADYHARLLRHVFTPDGNGRLPYDVVAWAEPAKSGKSAIAGLCAEYAGLHLDGDVILASNKRNQAASLMYKSLTDSVEFNRHLPNVEPGRYEVTFRNGNTVRAIPSNSRGEAGARFSLACFDEPWGMIYEDAIRLWGEFKNDPTRQSSLKLSIGYGGYDDSLLWKEQLETGLKGEPVAELLDIEDGRGQPACWANGRHFVFWSHQTRQPWQTAEWLDSQRKSLRPAEYSRMILADFAAGVGDFVDPDVWEALVDPDLQPLGPGQREPVYIGLDLAVKPGGDDAALVGLYPKDDKIACAFHKVWHGGRQRKVDLRISQTVKPAILAAAKRFNVAMIALDPWQAMGLGQDLRAAGLPVVEVPQTHQSRGPADTALYDLARYGNLVLYDVPELVGAAASASAKELGNGLLFITKTGRGKIDLLIAMSNALFSMAVPAYRYEIVYEPIHIGG